MGDRCGGSRRRDPGPREEILHRSGQGRNASHRVIRSRIGGYCKWEADDAPHGFEYANRPRPCRVKADFGEVLQVFLQGSRVWAVRAVPSRGVSVGPGIAGIRPGTCRNG